MKPTHLAILGISILTFSGCFWDCPFKKDEVTKLSGNIFYDVSFFLDKSNPRSKRLGGSTEDYGYGRENRDAYIMKFYSTYDCDEEIPTSNIYFTGALDQHDQKWFKIADPNFEYEIRYLYTKEKDGSYKEFKNYYGGKIAIRECYDDGYCKTYKDWDGKTHYIKKKFLEPYNLEKDLKILNER